MKRWIIFAGFLLIFAAEMQAQDFRVFPGSVTQTEPVVAVSPVDSNFLFVSAVTINTSNGFKSEGVYISADAGLHWSGSDTCKGSSILNHGGDPAVMITPGNRLVLTHIGSVFNGVYSHYSNDSGKTWSNSYTITSNQPEDKGTSTIDDSPTSPYYGRLYSAWVNYVIPYPVLVSYSTNSGESWTTPDVVNDNPPQRCSSGNIKTAEDGKVYVCWAGVESASPFKEDYVGFASSTDGGVSWNVNQNIYDVNGITGTLPQKSNIKVNGLPQMAIDKTDGVRNGWIYIVTTEINTEFAGTDPDIILRRSSDGGSSWSAGIRVNKDVMNDGNIQYFPAIDIDRYGGINILFYDDRNTTSDSAEVFLTRSTDGGDTWNEQVVSTHRFKPKPINGAATYYQGDHIALTAVGNRLYAFWMDDYSGIYQVWGRVIGIAPNAVNEETPMPGNFALQQNYPNPFNPATIIKYTIPQSLKGNVVPVSIKIYDILGNEVAEIMNEEKAPGSYEVKFNASGLTSGVYFYKLQTPEVSITKKMMVLK